MLPNETEKLDPRVRRTRQLLIEAFSALIEEKGFAALNVNDITDRAGVNRATFYAHFPDKFALLDHFIQETFRSVVDTSMLNACQFSLDNVHKLTVIVCEFIAKTHQHCHTIDQQYQSQIEAQVREQVYGLVLHWLENMDTLNPCSVSRERAATAASWVIYGLAHQWAREKPHPHAGQFASEVLPLIAANLGQTIELA